MFVDILLFSVELSYFLLSVINKRKYQYSHFFKTPCSWAWQYLNPCTYYNFIRSACILLVWDGPPHTPYIDLLTRHQPTNGHRDQTGVTPFLTLSTCQHAINHAVKSSRRDPTVGRPAVATWRVSVPNVSPPVSLLISRIRFQRSLSFSSPFFKYLKR